MGINPRQAQGLSDMVTWWKWVLGAVLRYDFSYLFLSWSKVSANHRMLQTVPYVGSHRMKLRCLRAVRTS